MDPLSSLGLACNVIQLIDFGAKLIKQGGQIARKGQTNDHAHIQILAEDAQDLCQLLLGNPPHRSRHTATLATRIVDANAQSSNGLQSPLNPDQKESVMKLAAKTQEVATNLNELLQKVRTKPSSAKGAGPRAMLKGKLVAAKQLAKAIHHDEAIQDAKRNLQELQQAMMLHMSLAQSQSSADIMTRFEKIAKEDREARMRLLKLVQGKTDEVSKQCARSDDPAMHSLAEQLDMLAPTVTQHSLWVIALQTLAYEEMYRRAETIAEAHASTYEWIFLNHDLGFVDWLTNKDGCFWITGKPGSGKSTLMKYIAREKRTEKLLATWAGPQRLVVLYHYFWSAGSQFQKSIDGLLRTVLHQLIRACPKLVTEVQPASWWLSSQSYEAWSGTVLRQAIERCGLAFPRLNMRVCMFIDGLDECEDEQHSELVDLISWLNRSSNIKVCTASRPWNVFKAAYECKSDGSLAMHTLTQQDICRYITDKLTEHEHFLRIAGHDPTACDGFVLAFMQRADGVFLWVSLVLRSLLKGLHNEDTIHILRLRLSEYPTSLDAYFQRMLDRIEDVYKVHSARILISVVYQTLIGPSDLIFLEMECANPCYAESMTIGIDDTTMDAHDVAVTDRYLDARCADLLWIQQPGPVHDHSVNLIHRTAADFLERPVVRSKLFELAGSSFDCLLSLQRRYVARYKTEYPDVGRRTVWLTRLVLLGSIVMPCHDENVYQDLLRSIVKCKQVYSTRGTSEGTIFNTVHHSQRSYQGQLGLRKILEPRGLGSYWTIYPHLTNSDRVEDALFKEITRVLQGRPTPLRCLRGEALTAREITALYRGNAIRGDGFAHSNAIRDGGLTPGQDETDRTSVLSLLRRKCRKVVGYSCSPCDDQAVYCLHPGNRVHLGLW